jgi:hypothetical protein
VFPIILSCCIGAALRKHNTPESTYRDEWCALHNGITEVKYSRARIDCVTPNYAVEVEFASKWEEAIGQSLYYSTLVHKQPAIYLIIEKESDKYYLEQLNSVIDYYKLPIKVFTDLGIEKD